MSVCHAAAIVCLASLLSACGGISSPSKNAVQDFAGTLQMGDSNGHPFSVGKSGEFFVTLVEMSDRTLTIGTGLAEVVNGTCQLIFGYAQPFSRWNQQALGGPINKGNYCVIVYDPNTLTAPLTYTVRVSHP